MHHKRFTISAYWNETNLPPELRTNLQALPKPIDGYDTIGDVIAWCDENKVAYDLVCITEWDIDADLDGYGVPDIVAQVNLLNAVMDEVENLGRYSTY